MNKEFWKEVLEGRTISEVKFDDDGIGSLTLDSGEEIFVAGDKRRLYIQDDL